MQSSTNVFAGFAFKIEILISFVFISRTSSNGVTDGGIFIFEEYKCA